jgi:rod shape determining protein RodA
VFLPWGDPPTEQQLRAEHYHSRQSAIAVGSGGVTGKGLSTVAHVHVPEPETDFIFTTIAERWGFLGVLLVFGLQLALLVSLADLAARTREPSGKLLVVGVSAPRRSPG